MNESNFDDEQTAEALGDDELNEDGVWQRDPKIVVYNWTKDATRLLIGLRTTLDAEFEDSTQKKMDLWERISGVLSDHGFEFPPGICDKKWRNLLVSFRRTVSRGNQGQINRFPYRWEFYTDLLEYAKKKDPASFDMIGSNDSGSDNDDFMDDEGDDDDGDMNQFLAVTLDDSEEGETIDEQVDSRNGNETAKTSLSFPNSLPLPPSLVMAPSVPSQLRPGSSGPAAAETPPPLQQQSFLAQLNLTQVTPSSSNSGSLRGRKPDRVFPNVIIEEVTPSNSNRAKRSLPDSDEGEIPFQMGSTLNHNQWGLNISLRERERVETVAPVVEMSFNGSGSNAKRRRAEAPEVEDLRPPAWFRNHVKQVVDWEKVRWEEEKALRAQEFKIRTREIEFQREMKLKELQAMNRLTSVLCSFAKDSRPAST